MKAKSDDTDVNTNLGEVPKVFTPERRRVSPLMLRVMAVNGVALAILIFGLLYLNQFRDNLIETRLTNLEQQAIIIAGALGEGAIDGPEAEAIDVEAAKGIMIRLINPTTNRARLFDDNRFMLLDSRELAADSDVYEALLLDPDYEPSFMEKMENWLNGMLDMMVARQEYPLYIEGIQDTAGEYSEALIALSGSNASAVRQTAEGQIVATVAVPVARFKRVLGVLLVTADTRDIDALVRQEQIFTLQVFAGGLAVTLFLSFFLSRTIAKPISRLAGAAERVRSAIGREESIPEFANRRDEIGDLSRSLSEMTRALYNQIGAIERFAADVAHELKNPLTSMRSALETLERTEKPDQRRQMLAIIADDVRRLDRLITDISDASRLDAELARGEMAEVDIGSMLNTLVDAYRTTRADKGVELAFDQGEPGVFVVDGIRPRLGQVWRNLIDNAYSFSDKGQTVSITLTFEDEWLIVRVSDEGIGLPAGSEEKIFSRFYSERPDSEEFGTHSGLGLAISEQIIKAHAGTIRAVNNMEKGASFIVALPRKK